MRIVGNVMLDESVFEQRFVCNLTACKGACCVEGEGGAPLLPEEAHQLVALRDALEPFLSAEGISVLAQQGSYVFREGEYETPLQDGNGPCAYAIFNPDGTAQCGIENAFLAGAVDFRKPISCHLYPIRVELQGAFDYLYYHAWHVCAPACTQGDRLGVSVVEFVREALIRCYGEEFYAVVLAMLAARRAEEASTASETAPDA